MHDTDDPTPAPQSNGAGPPPRPPHNTAVGFSGDDDDDWPEEFQELRENLSPEERDELLTWLRETMDSSD